MFVNAMENEHFKRAKLLYRTFEEHEFWAFDTSIKHGFDINLGVQMPIFIPVSKTQRSGRGQFSPYPKIVICDKDYTTSYCMSVPRDERRIKRRIRLSTTEYDVSSNCDCQVRVLPSF